jgi:hypothetical protein
MPKGSLAMTKNSAQKGQKLIAVIVLQLALVIGIWSLLVQPLHKAQHSKRKLLEATQEKAAEARRNIARAEKLKADLPIAQQKLASINAKMASGDVYRWMIRTFGNFHTNKVEIANLEPPRMGVSAILPKIPCQTATFSVSGTAFYHDFGKFLAQLENDFPHMRLQRLELEPAQFGEVVTPDQEQLNFKFEILALVNSTGEP